LVFGDTILAAGLSENLALMLEAPNVFIATNGDTGMPVVLEVAPYFATSFQSYNIEGIDPVDIITTPLFISSVGGEQIPGGLFFNPLSSLSNDAGPIGSQTWAITTQVPIPAASWLFMSALIGLAAKKRCSRQLLR
jgi:hypothetical protein